MIKLMSSIIEKRDYEILIIEDDELLAISIKDELINLFKNELRINIHPRIATTSNQAENELSRFEFDMVIYDIDLNGEVEGLNLLSKYKHKSKFNVVHSSKDDNVTRSLIFQNGADEHLVKQLPSKRPLVIKTMCESFLAYAYRPELENYVFSRFVTNDEELKTSLMEFLLTCCKDKLPVHITGETGVGKEIVSQLVQDFCFGPNIKLKVVHCGNLDDTNSESTLFGHKKGSFTGSISNEIGMFEAAEGESLLFDEVGDLQKGLQTKLLRAVWNKEGQRRGCKIVRKYNVKVISATSANLSKLVEQGAFKEDLEGRLKAHVLHIPPLRKRRGDILPQIEHHNQHGMKRACLSDEVLNFLCNEYSWRKNSREVFQKVTSWKNKNKIIELADISSLLDEEKENAFLEIAMLLSSKVQSYGLVSSLDAIEMTLAKYLKESTNTERGYKTAIREKLGNPSNGKWDGLRKKYEQYYGEQL